MDNQQRRRVFQWKNYQIQKESHYTAVGLRIRAVKRLLLPKIFKEIDDPVTNINSQQTNKQTNIVP